MTIDKEVVKERRQQISDDARCDGCGSTMAACKAERGKDPTAPPWFGCCARGVDMEPCRHRLDPTALSQLLNEIESGHVRTSDEVLLDSVPEYRRPRVSDLALVLSGWSDPQVDYYGD